MSSAAVAVSEPQPQLELPKNWDKWVSAAYLREVGGKDGTWENVAAAVGVTARTLTNWRADTKLWRLAQLEARERFLAGWASEADYAARRTVLRAIRKGDIDSAWKLLERRDITLAPPIQRVKGELDANVSGAFMHGVVELPAESVGLESEDPAVVLERMGRQVAQVMPPQLQPPAAPAPAPKTEPKGRAMELLERALERRKRPATVQLPEEEDGAE